MKEDIFDIPDEISIDLPKFCKLGGKNFAIKVLSRKDAANFTCEVPWAAISIASFPNEWPNLSEDNRVNLLQLYFFDQTVPGEHAFTENHAKEIIRFVGEAWGKIDCLLVHCEAGLSRSPGVAAAIARIFQGEGQDAAYFKQYYPNYLVYKILLETYFGKNVNLHPQNEETYWDDNDFIG
jgi:hypothetical protein